MLRRYATNDFKHWFIHYLSYGNMSSADRVLLFAAAGSAHVLCTPGEKLVGLLTPKDDKHSMCTYECGVLDNQQRIWPYSCAEGSAILSSLQEPSRCSSRSVKVLWLPLMTCQSLWEMSCVRHRHLLEVWSHRLKTSCRRWTDSLKHAALWTATPRIRSHTTDSFLLSLHRLVCLA